MERTSGRKRVLEILAKNPNGINAASIVNQVKSEYAIEKESVSQILVTLTREGKIRKLDKRECPHCFGNSTVYKIKTGGVS